MWRIGRALSAAIRQLTPNQESEVASVENSDTSHRKRTPSPVPLPCPLHEGERVSDNDSSGEELSGRPASADRSGVATNVASGLGGSSDHEVVDDLTLEQVSKAVLHSGDVAVSRFPPEKKPLPAPMAELPRADRLNSSDVPGTHLKKFSGCQRIVSPPREGEAGAAASRGASATLGAGCSASEARSGKVELGRRGGTLVKGGTSGLQSCAIGVDSTLPPANRVDAAVSLLNTVSAETNGAHLEASPALGGVESGIPRNYRRESMADDVATRGSAPLDECPGSGSGVLIAVNALCGKDDSDRAGDAKRTSLKSTNPKQETRRYLSQPILDEGDSPCESSGSSPKSRTPRRVPHMTDEDEEFSELLDFDPPEMESTLFSILDRRQNTRTPLRFYVGLTTQDRWELARKIVIHGGVIVADPGRNADRPPVIPLVDTKSRPLPGGRLVYADTFIAACITAGCLLDPSDFLVGRCSGANRGHILRVAVNDEPPKNAGMLDLSASVDEHPSVGHFAFTSKDDRALVEFAAEFMVSSGCKHLPRSLWGVAAKDNLLGRPVRGGTLRCRVERILMPQVKQRVTEIGGACEDQKKPRSPKNSLKRPRGSLDKPSTVAERSPGRLRKTPVQPSSVDRGATSRLTGAGRDCGIERRACDTESEDLGDGGCNNASASRERRDLSPSHRQCTALIAREGPLRRPENGQHVCSLTQPGCNVRVSESAPGLLSCVDSVKDTHVVIDHKCISSKTRAEGCEEVSRRRTSPVAEHARPGVAPSDAEVFYDEVPSGPLAATKSISSAIAKDRPDVNGVLDISDGLPVSGGALQSNEPESRVMHTCEAQSCPVANGDAKQSSRFGNASQLYKRESVRASDEAGQSTRARAEEKAELRGSGTLPVLPTSKSRKASSRSTRVPSNPVSSSGGALPCGSFDKAGRTRGAVRAKATTTGARQPLRGGTHVPHENGHLQTVEECGRRSLGAPPELQGASTSKKHWAPVLGKLPSSGSQLSSGDSDHHTAEKDGPASVKRAEKKQRACGSMKKKTSGSQKLPSGDARVPVRSGHRQPAHGYERRSLQNRKKLRDVSGSQRQSVDPSLKTSTTDAKDFSSYRHGQPADEVDEASGPTGALGEGRMGVRTAASNLQDARSKKQRMCADDRVMLDERSASADSDIRGHKASGNADGSREPVNAIKRNRGQSPAQGVLPTIRKTRQPTEELVRTVRGLAKACGVSSRRAFVAFRGCGGDFKAAVERLRQDGK